MSLLAGLFFITALIYAAIGFGGGSTYTAILSLADVDYRIMPLISLCCNIIVTAGGSYRFTKAGQLNFRRFAPWIVLSIPFAFLGGMLPISKLVFFSVLGLALLLSGMRLVFKPALDAKTTTVSWLDEKVALLAGGGLGLLAGVTGIGGGIYLAPLLHFLRWGNAREIAAACSFFILLNSLAGLLGQFVKLQQGVVPSELFDYWYLLLAVAIGGAIGSWLGVSRLPLLWIIKVTGLLTCYAGVQLLWKFWQLL